MRVHQNQQLHTVLYINQILPLQKLPNELNCRSPSWSPSQTWFFFSVLLFFGSIGAPFWRPWHLFSSSSRAPFFDRFLKPCFIGFGTQNEPGKGDQALRFKGSETAWDPIGFQRHSISHFWHNFAAISAPFGLPLGSLRVPSGRRL